MREGRLGYNSYNKRYGLLSSDLWIDTGFHCGEYLEVLLVGDPARPIFASSSVVRSALPHVVISASQASKIPPGVI